MKKINKCSCGRSPTGNCIGWHNLTEKEYLRKKELHPLNKIKKLNKNRDV
tara:strand:+ start:547 stop:696 length:150 start_codon:yes stop_codon:yes gene_type:complete